MGQPHRGVGEQDHRPGQEDGQLGHAGRPVWDGCDGVDDGQEPQICTIYI